jgi:hypothetical protein
MPGDVVGVYALVVFVGFEQGWYGFGFAVATVTRLRRRPMSWNTALGLLLILTVALSAVIFTVLSGLQTLSGAYALLPATLIASTFCDGLSVHAWSLYRAVKAHS